MLLPLGSPVLEPDLHLGLGEAEAQRQVEPFADAEVPGGLEFVLQGDELLVGEGGPGATRFAGVLGFWVGFLLFGGGVFDVFADVALDFVVVVGMLFFTCKEERLLY